MVVFKQPRVGALVLDAMAALSNHTTTTTTTTTVTDASNAAVQTM